MKITYRVNKIKSRHADEREGNTEKSIESHIGDFDTLEAAKVAYDAEKTGMEVDKELVELRDADSANCEEKVIESTY